MFPFVVKEYQLAILCPDIHDSVLIVFSHLQTQHSSFLLFQMSRYLSSRNLFFNHFKSNGMQKQIEPLGTLEHRPCHIRAIPAGKQVWQFHRHGNRTGRSINTILLQHIGDTCIGAGEIKSHVFYGGILLLLIGNVC